MGICVLLSISILPRTEVLRLSLTNSTTAGKSSPMSSAANMMLFLLGNVGNELPCGMSIICVGTGV